MNAATNFDRAFAAIVGVEGSYTDDPNDPGGSTKYGLSSRANPDLDIKGLLLEDAKRIYQLRYWQPAHCDALPWPLALFVFDAAVNQGVDTAVKLLQKSVGTVQDGALGKNTLTAIAHADQRELPAMYMADRALRYTGTRNFDIYGRGWLKRLFVITINL